MMNDELKADCRRPRSSSIISRSSFLLLSAFACCCCDICLRRRLSGLVIFHAGCWNGYGSLPPVRVRHAFNRAAMRRSRPDHHVASDYARRNEEQDFSRITARLATLEQLAENGHARYARCAVERVTFGIHIDSAHDCRAAVLNEHG